MTVDRRLLILDLDNTLYDWVSSFVPAAYAMIEKASEILQVSIDQVVDELKVVNQRHGDTEHPQAIFEIASALRQFMDAPEIAKALEPSVVCFQDTNAHLLQLYPGVKEKLEDANRSGVTMVAYTDARVASSLSRVNFLGLRPYLTQLFTPDQRVSPYMMRSSDREFVSVLPHDERKPNPAALLDICRRCNVTPDKALYVGDSLVRDIYMAKQAGILSAWARYGTTFDPGLWTKLVAITHWTEIDVLKEAQVRERAGTVMPDVVLDRFSDLRLTH
ncbi:HAD family hydrolase [Rhizobium leguminosarum]|uniref:HAD family hydrolase n=1 Tax=Rhizobium leguminosarum TaxID=384 RepID=UPI00140FBB8E|nr:HAD family hydrolase [Rhizobium leguminosarum]QIO59966.1 HAD family hydrolase [Rhizobium leguminosarum bv. trifolii]